MKSWNNARSFPHQAGPSWGVVFTVRYSCGVCDTVHPEVGIVIAGAENHRRTFWDDPVLSGQSGNNSEPSHTDRTQSNRSPRTSPPFAASCWAEKETVCVCVCVCVRAWEWCMYFNNEIKQWCLSPPVFGNFLCSLPLETGKTTWFDLISSFSFPCYPARLSRKRVLKNLKCTVTAYLMN